MTTTKTIDKNKALKTFSPWKIILAILFGLGVSAYMLYGDITENPEHITKFLASDKNYFWLFMAFLVMIARDIGYIYRIKTITEGQVNIRGCFYIIMLWEFASAVTPSVVGGTLVAIFIINNMGISFGKSLAYVMITAIFDNLFFITFGPLVIAIVGLEKISTTITGIESLGDIDLFWPFVISYTLIALYTLFMAWGLFLKPEAFRNLLFRFTKIRFLKRFKRKAIEQGNEVVIASKEFKGKPISYWIKVSLSTIFVWSARYLVVNCLFAAFTDAFSSGAHTHMEAYAKQVVLWVAQLLSLTPGGAGLAELFFTQFYIGYGPAGILSIIAFIWRLITYYPYLIMGSIVLPRWLKRVYTTPEIFLKKGKATPEGG